MSLWPSLRSCFPITDTAIHLDHAGGSPIPSRVDEAVRAFVDDASRRHDPARAEQVLAEVERVRRRLALLLGSAPEEVAFVSDALRGLEAVIGDVSWRPGDVLLGVGDGLQLPASLLASHGVDVRSVPLARGAFSLERIEQALTHPRARLLVLASVQSESGARAPLGPLSELCAARGVLLCVDASHHAGSLSLHLRRDGIDYLVSDGHRFLLGLPGTGVLLRNARIAREPGPAALRFERGEPNALGIVALGAATDLLLELSIEAVEKRVLELTDRLVDGLGERGLDPRVSRSAARSAIVRFHPASQDAERLARRLAKRGIQVAARPDGLRVSPHAYNTPAEIDALLDAL